jgi:hypothetical protein
MIPDVDVAPNGFDSTHFSNRVKTIVAILVKNRVLQTWVLQMSEREDISMFLFILTSFLNQQR